MDEKIARLLSWAQGKPQGPVILELNVTNLCNLKCLSCWQRAVSGFDRKRELSDDRLLQLVGEAAALGVKEIRIPGSGEPFMRGEGLLTVMRAIKRQGMRGLVITNGVLLKERWLEELVALGWDNLTISLDSPRRRIHDRMRGKWGTFSSVKKVLKLLDKAKARTQASLPFLRFNTVLTSLNYQTLPDLVKFASDHGCEAISVQPMTVFSPIGEKIKIDAEGRKLMQPYLQRAQELAARYKIFTNVGQYIDGELVEKSNRMTEVIRESIKSLENSETPEHEFLRTPCFEPFYNLIILPEGETGPCSVFGGKGGDDARTRSIEQIWYGPIFQRIRERLLRQIMEEFCKRCCVPVFSENQRLREELRNALTFKA